MNSRYVNTWGLTDAELACVMDNAPFRRGEVVYADCYSDVMVHCDDIAVVINPTTVKPDELAMVISFYEDIADNFSGKIIFTAPVKLPTKLKKIAIISHTFEELEENIKYYILSAYKKTKKSYIFSEALSHCILISRMIVKKPGITTKELATMIEKSERTVLRYIEAIRLAGEYIDYDPQLKGWKLSFNESVLWDYDKQYKIDTEEKGRNV